MSWCLNIKIMFVLGIVQKWFGVNSLRLSLMPVHYIVVIITTMASQSPASRLFTQPFIQTQIKENNKAPRQFTGTGEFPAQRANNAENVSIWWRHHAYCPGISHIFVQDMTRLQALFDANLNRISQGTYIIFNYQYNALTRASIIRHIFWYIFVPAHDSHFVDNHGVFFKMEWSNFEQYRRIHHVSKLMTYNIKTIKQSKTSHCLHIMWCTLCWRICYDYLKAWNCHCSSASAESPGSLLLIWINLIPA